MILRTIAVFAFTLLTSLGYSQTVYATKDGKKYHKKNCTIVKEGKKGVDVKDAKKQGLQPCQVCKPDQIAEEKKKATK